MFLDQSFGSGLQVMGRQFAGLPGFGLPLILAIIE